MLQQIGAFVITCNACGRRSGPITEDVMECQARARWLSWLFSADGQHLCDTCQDELAAGKVETAIAKAEVKQ